MSQPQPPSGPQDPDQPPSGAAQPFPPASDRPQPVDPTAALPPVPEPPPSYSTDPYAPPSPYAPPPVSGVPQPASGQPYPSYQPGTAPPPVSGAGYPPVSGAGYPPSAPGYSPVSGAGYPPPAPGYPPPAGTGYPPPPGGPGGPGYQWGPPPTASSGKKVWIIIGVVIAVVLLLCCGGLVVAAVAGSQRADEAAEEIDRSVPAPDITRAPVLPGDRPSAGPSPTDDETFNLRAGETLVISDDDGTIEITVRSFTTSSKGCRSFAPPPNKGMYLIANVTATVTKGTASINPFYFQWVADDGTTVNGLAGALSGCGGDMLDSGSGMRTGSKRSGAVVFDVADKSGAVEYQHKFEAAGSWKP
ncbi:DUF4352 domain-containing protein [Micromonospora rifamycinica]|uniref:hypothetical protein n=1 Tax=Micromonospora rifamycinica TaxID=291594 RepID=UPI002E2D72E5|nr:hypothetical protein [Micromonospora rifamycinica]